MALLLTCLPLTAEAREVPEDLAPVYRAWLEEVELLLSDEERQAFLELEKDYQRDGFIARFWDARDPVARTERNEFKEDWYARLDEARQLYGRLDDARSRIRILNGPPVQSMEEPCARHFRPAEVWVYGELPEPLVLVFVRPSAKQPYKLWKPADRVFDLVEDPEYQLWERCSARPGDRGVNTTRLPKFQEAEYRCLFEQLPEICPLDHEDVLAVLSRVAPMEPNEFELVLQRVEQRPRARNSEWLTTFTSYSTDMPDGAEPLDARVEVLFPGRRGARTLVQGVLSVAVESARAAELAGRRSYDFQLTGEVLRAGELFESFRYRFDFPAEEGDGAALPMVFQRLLRPGSYELVLKVDDLHSERCFRHVLPLEVPAVEAAAEAPASGPMDEALRVMTGAETSLRLVPPQGDVHVGMVRIDTLYNGEPLAMVRFYLDGEEVLAKKRPPYSVELDLGRVPRVRTIRVAGLNEDGEEVAGDEIEVNTGRHHFAIRLVEPRRGQRYAASLLARAEVQVPDGSRLERVELLLNETRLATLFQPPFEQVLMLEDAGELAYVRAVAHLEDGNSAEDVVFVNAPDYLEELDVRLVELYTSVVDAAGHPVDSLTQDDFTVAEDGVEQRILRFDRLQDRPIHAVVLLDTSASMEKKLAAVRQAALKFLEETITPKDRAAVVTFNDVPRLAVELTNRIEPMAREMALLAAEGGTALWDSVVFSLHYSGGATGQRAILLLSDGEDESSRFSFDEALDYARYAGVSLYAIGLDLPIYVDARGKLKRLSEATGGRAFFIDDVGELGRVYSTIERELRSKYLTVYQSSNDDEGFRRIGVTLNRPGLEARTIQGYYP